MAAAFEITAAEFVQVCLVGLLIISFTEFFLTFPE